MCCKCTDAIEFMTMLYEDPYNLEKELHNCEYVVMEVSSHAIELNRIDGLKFSACLFTNLTEDHLDFHKTMENYMNCKLKLINYLMSASCKYFNNLSLDSF